MAKPLYFQRSVTFHGGSSFVYRLLRLELEYSVEDVGRDSGNVTILETDTQFNFYRPDNEPTLNY